jgi:hypothetical protein
MYSRPTCSGHRRVTVARASVLVGVHGRYADGVPVVLAIERTFG